MGWKTLAGSGGAAETATVIHAGEPQTDGAVRFSYGVDSSGRPTWTAAGTADTPAIVMLDDGRFFAREVSF